MTADSNKNLKDLIRSNPYYRTISSIVHWEEPPKTGIIFLIINTFFILLIFGEYSFVTLVSYVFLALLLISAIVSVGMKVIGNVQKQNFDNPLVNSLQDKDFQIPPSVIDSQLELVHYFIDQAINTLLEAFLLRRKSFTLKVAAVLFFLSMVGNLFSNTVLVYLGLLGAFIFPLTYQQKKTEIDNFASVAFQKSRDLSNQAYEKLPPAMKETLND
eukprot:TRINITY_DN6367_c0_g1_i1.p1 TRINITY_DN6367_c0_g1~~TRINITY_DN6367_c0_g1_i1.p1  ORF type:complete len:215 (+),score=41.29 TRINITY_DN6367_c0_g1_i1:49-693(+)